MSARIVSGEAESSDDELPPPQPRVTQGEDDSSDLDVAMPTTSATATTATAGPTAVAGEDESDDDDINIHAPTSPTESSPAAPSREGSPQATSPTAADGSAARPVKRASGLGTPRTGSLSSSAKAAVPQIKQSRASQLRAQANLANRGGSAASTPITTSLSASVSGRPSAAGSPAQPGIPSTPRTAKGAAPSTRLRSQTTTAGPVSTPRTTTTRPHSSSVVQPTQADLDKASAALARPKVKRHLPVETKPDAAAADSPTPDPTPASPAGSTSSGKPKSEKTTGFKIVQEPAAAKPTAADASTKDSEASTNAAAEPAAAAGDAVNGTAAEGEAAPSPQSVSSPQITTTIKGRLGRGSRQSSTAHGFGSVEEEDPFGDRRTPTTMGDSAEAFRAGSPMMEDTPMTQSIDPTPRLPAAPGGFEDSVPPSAVPTHYAGILSRVLQDQGFPHGHAGRTSGGKNAPTPSIAALVSSSAALAKYYETFPYVPAELLLKAAEEKKVRTAPRTEAPPDMSPLEPGPFAAYTRLDPELLAFTKRPATAEAAAAHLQHLQETAARREVQETKSKAVVAQLLAQMEDEERQALSSSRPGRAASPSTAAAAVDDEPKQAEADHDDETAVEEPAAEQDDAPELAAAEGAEDDVLHGDEHEVDPTIATEEGAGSRFDRIASTIAAKKDKALGRIVREAKSRLGPHSAAAQVAAAAEEHGGTRSSLQSRNSDNAAGSGLDGHECSADAEKVAAVAAAAKKLHRVAALQSAAAAQHVLKEGANATLRHEQQCFAARLEISRASTVSKALCDAMQETCAIWGSSMAHMSPTSPRISGDLEC